MNKRASEPSFFNTKSRIVSSFRPAVVSCKKLLWFFNKPVSKYLKYFTFKLKE